MNIDYTRNVVRRSRLMVPANNPELIKNAYMSNADAIILDLEGGVPMAEKVATRQTIKDSIPLVARSGATVLVRVNSMAGFLREDIEASVWPGVDGIYVPDIETPEQVQEIAGWIADLEQKRGIPAGHVKISILIESCLGYMNLKEIVQADERLDSLTIGNKDFLLEAGMQEIPENYNGILMVRMQMMLASRAFGKIPLGLLGNGFMGDLSDPASLEKKAILAFQHGYLGSTCFNFNDVAPLNKGFSPTSEELEWSKRVIFAMDEAAAQGKTSATLDGKTIDYVQHGNALQMMKRQGLIDELELKKKTAREAVGN